MLPGKLSSGSMNYSALIGNGNSSELNITKDVSEDSTPSENSTPVIVRKLREIYESCSFTLFVTQFENFEEEQQSDVWKKAV